MKTILAWLTRKQPVIAAGLAAGAIDLAGRFGFHLPGNILAIVGAVSTILLATVAHTKVGSPNTMAALIEAVDKGLGVAIGTADATVVVAPDPSVAGEAAIGGAAGGAAGAAAGGAVGGALGSVLGALAEGVDKVLGRKEKP